MSKISSLRSIISFLGSVLFIIVFLSGCLSSQGQVKNSQVENKADVLKVGIYKAFLTTPYHFSGKLYPKGTKVDIYKTKVHKNYVKTSVGEVNEKHLKILYEKDFAKLRVDVQPRDAKVEILNIEERYRDNIKLKKNKYHIQVTKEGFKYYDKWITLNNDITINIVLKKNANQYIPSKTDYFKYVSDIKWDSHNEYFYQKYDAENNLIWAMPLALKEATQDKKIIYASSCYGDYSAYGKYPKSSQLPYLYLYRDGKLISERDGEDIKVGNADLLLINGQINTYRKPYSKEVFKNNPFKDVQKYLLSSYWYYNICHHTTLGIYTKDTGHRQNVMKYEKCANSNANGSTDYSSTPLDKQCNSSYNRGLRHTENGGTTVLVRHKSFYDKIIFSNEAPLKKLAQLTTLLTLEKLNVAPVRVGKSIKTRVNIPFSNEPRLTITLIEHTKKHTIISFKITGAKDRDAFLHTGGDVAFKLNNKEFIKFDYKNNTYKCKAKNFKKVKFDYGTVKYYFKRINSKVFTLSEGNSKNAWKAVNVDSKIDNIFVKPTAPIVEEPHVLHKGEFEKTTDFEKRKKGEIKRVVKLNSSKQKAYQKELMQFNSLVNQAEIAYKKQVAYNKKASTIKKVANEASKEAITMVFGDPKFKDFKYDADNEIFNATLYSTLNNFSMRIKIPVGIKKAKEFKRKLLDERLVPSVTFSVEKGKLHFKNVSVVANSIKEKEEYKLATSKNTIAAYNNFLHFYATAPQAKKAKKAIKKIKEQQRLEKIRKEKRAKAAAKRAAEQKEKERQAYMKRKNVGDKVCIDGKVAFFINVTVSAYVERINGDEIQLRINSTEGQTFHYNGGKLYPGKVLWDTYYQWKHCE